jgi:hypothetical protein
MTPRLRIVAATALVRLYPAAWRREYGPELADTLMARPLDARIVGDVLWNGLRQRVRMAEPSTLLGLAAMLVILIGLAWNIAAPPSAADGLAALLRDSSKTQPTVIVTPLASELFVLLLVACGCWTNLRHDGTLLQSSASAMRLSLIAGSPIVLAGIMMVLGILRIVALGPGDAPTTFLEDRFTYTYYSAQHHAPSAMNVLLAPLFKLPESWIWGLLGGQLGRTLSRARHSQTVSS